MALQFLLVLLANLFGQNVNGVFNIIKVAWINILVSFSRDAKICECMNNVCVYFFLARVKSSKLLHFFVEKVGNVAIMCCLDNTYGLQFFFRFNFHFKKNWANFTYRLVAHSSPLFNILYFYSVLLQIHLCCNLRTFFGKRFWLKGSLCKRLYFCKSYYCELRQRNFLKRKMYRYYNTSQKYIFCFCYCTP